MCSIRFKRDEGIVYAAIERRRVANICYIQYAIWNQSTSQLKTSKYRDINVVREILQIRRDLEQSLRHFLFEINDTTTWDLVNSAVNTYLANLVSEQAIEDFSCSVYASEYDVTLHKLRVDVMIQPKQVIYQILLTISV